MDKLMAEFDHSQSSSPVFDPSVPSQMHVPAIGLGEDIMRSAGSGLVRAATGAAWPLAAFTSGHLGEMISKYGSSYGRDYSPGRAIGTIGRVVGGLTGTTESEKALEDINQATDYEPQTVAGKYIKTGASLSPAGLFNGSWFSRMARVVAPTLFSEKLGEHFAGTKYEQPAKLAGAVIGSVGEGLAENAPGIARTLGAVPAQERAVNAIEKMAGGPVSVDARQIIPGSRPTMAEAMTDVNPNVAGLQKAAQGSSQTGNFERQVAENHAARKEFFDKLAGTPADIESMTLARDAITGPLRENAFKGSGEAEVRSVDQLISRILKSPAGQRDLVARELQNVRDKIQVENPLSERVVDALDPLKAELAKPTTGVARRADLMEARRLLISAQRGHTTEDELVAGLSNLAKSQKIVGPIDNALKVIKSGDVGYQTDAEQLYGIRQHIGDILTRLSGEPGVSKTASGELYKVVKALDDSIENVAPGYRKYLDTFSELSKPIDRAKYLQGLKLTDPLGNITLSRAKSALENTNRLRAEGGIHPSKSLSDKDMAAMQALHDDLRAAENIKAGRADLATYRAALGGKTLADYVPPNLHAIFGRYLKPELTGAILGGAAGSTVGHAELGAAAGAGAGGIFGHAMGSRADEVAKEIERMLLNPEAYERASAAASSARQGASGIVPRLLSSAAPAAVLSGQSLINSGVPGRASGGDVEGGKPYIVGERGPEVVVPKKSGRVIPN